MSRIALTLAAGLTLIAVDARAQDAEPVSAAAQSTDPDGENQSETGVADLTAEEVLADSEEVAGPPLPPECEPDPLNNRIVVCAKRNDDEFRLQDGFDPEKVSLRGGVPAAPDVFGIPHHGVIIPMGWAPKPVVLIDLEAIPEAPPGSDADRVARGLAPRGQDDGSGAPAPAEAEEAD